MPDKMGVELGNVQKTLFLPLWGRATESRKEHPLLVDPTAVRILDEADYDFGAIAAGISELSRMAWIMRSICVDRAVAAFLKEHPQATVVNIGCGLDTTFERVDNGKLRWIDLDLPDVIELRRRFVHESERRRFIAASFLDEGWLDEIQTGQPVFFIAAGVFYYFEAGEVRSFLVRLAERFPGSQILFDVSSPLGIRVANRVVIRQTGLDEKSFLKWGLRSPKDILDWDPRLRLLATDYYFGARSGSLPFKTRFFGFISDRLKIQYMLHLEISK